MKPIQPPETSPDGFHEDQIVTIDDKRNEYHGMRARIAGWYLTFGRTTYVLQILDPNHLIGSARLGAKKIKP